MFLPTGWFPYVEIQCFLLLCFLGWGGVGIITNVPFAPLLDLFVTRHATLRDLVLCLMLRYLIFLSHVMLRCVILCCAWCSATWSFCDTSCYAAWSCLGHHWFLLGYDEKNLPTQLAICPQNQRELNDLIWTYVRAWQWRWETALVGFALLKKNRHPFVKDVTVTVYDCKTWGFGEKKLAARPIFKWGIRKIYSNYQWFCQNAIARRVQTSQKHAQNAGKRRIVLTGETPKNSISRVRLSTRRDVFQCFSAIKL